jgi:vesicular inhibitory amino acid transporter
MTAESETWYAKVETQDDGGHEQGAPQASLTAITMNLITAGLGTGILSLPWATAGASLLPSMAMTAAVMTLNGCTCMIIISAGERWKAFDLGALLSNLPGRCSPVVQAFCNTLTWVSVFLCLVGYIVVIADALESLLAANFAGPATRAILLTISSIGILPVCFLDQRLLSFSSSLGIAINVYMFVLVAGLLAQEGTAPGICVAGAGTGLVTLFSTLMQCGIIQMCVLPMYEELKDRNPRRFQRAVFIAFSFLTLLFGAFSALAYLRYGPGVRSNITNDFPDNSLGNMAKVGMAIVVLAVYPIILKSMTAPIQHWEQGRHSGQQWRSRLSTVAIVAFSGVSASFAGRLGTIQALNGALQVSAFVAVAPGLTGLFLLGRRGPFWQGLMFGLMALGFVATALGVVYTSNDVDSVAEHCLWQA